MAPDKSHIAYGAVSRFPHREPPAFTVGHSDGGDTDEKGISHYGDGCHGGGNHDDRAGRGARLGPPRFRHWTRTGVRSGSALTAGAIAASEPYYWGPGYGYYGPTYYYGGGPYAYYGGPYYRHHYYYRHYW